MEIEERENQSMKEEKEIEEVLAEESLMLRWIYSRRNRRRAAWVYYILPM